MIRSELIVAQLGKTFPAFMVLVLEGSLLCSQEPVIGRYLEVAGQNVAHPQVAVGGNGLHIRVGC
jgi:hypothetical protein